MEHKTTEFELKLHEEAGEFEGYASIFGDVDQGADAVEPGAFAKSLASGRKVKLLWQHDMNEPIGSWLDIREDERGLYVKGQLLTTVQRGAEALSLLKAGIIDSLSIGYRTKIAEKVAGVRRLKELDLFEISLVTFPMLESASISSVKSIRTIRDFETALRDAGFSRTEAKAIAAEGFKGLAEHRDDVELDGTSEGLKALASQIKQLKERISNAL